MGCCSSSEQEGSKDFESLNRRLNEEDALLGNNQQPAIANAYPSITTKPANLDVTKSARKRRKQNDRCQRVLNQQTAEQGAATAPGRSDSATRTIKGNETDIRALVKTPAFAEVNDWLALHTVDFYNDLSLLCGTVLEFCEQNETGGQLQEVGGAGVEDKQGGCDTMTAGPKYQYLWKDEGEFKSPTELSAAQYLKVALAWIDSRLDDAELFPSENVGYGSRFRPTVRKIFKLFFRIYAHLYHSHFSDFVKLEAETHLNDSFRHFIFFVKEFKLIKSSELPPLHQLISFLEQQNEDQERQRSQVRTFQLQCARFAWQSVWAVLIIPFRFGFVYSKNRIQNHIDCFVRITLRKMEGIPNLDRQETL